MHRTRVNRDIALAVLASGAAALVAAIRPPDALTSDLLRGLLLTYGPPAMLIGGGLAFHFHRKAMARDALARGDGVMLRWRIEPALWRDFLALEARLCAEPNALPNDLPLDPPVPGRGLEVIAGREALQVGDALFTLPRRGEPQVTRATMVRSVTGVTYVELQLFTPQIYGDGSRPPRWSVLRVPVQRGAEREAMGFVAHYESGRPAEPGFLHGRGDGSDADDESVCKRCGFRTHKLISGCPQCHGNLLSRRWARRFGVAMGVLGLGLVVGMAVLLHALLPMLLHPGRSFGSTRFDGGPLAAAMVIAVLGAVLVFGCVAAVHGFRQGRDDGKGPRSWPIALGLAGAVAALAWLV